MRRGCLGLALGVRKPAVQGVHSLLQPLRGRVGVCLAGRHLVQLLAQGCGACLGHQHVAVVELGVGLCPGYRILGIACLSDLLLQRHAALVGLGQCVTRGRQLCQSRRQLGRCSCAGVATQLAVKLQLRQLLTSLLQVRGKHVLRLLMSRQLAGGTLLCLDGTALRGGHLALGRGSLGLCRSQLLAEATHLLAQLLVRLFPQLRARGRVAERALQRRHTGMLALGDAVLLLHVLPLRRQRRLAAPARRLQRRLRRARVRTCSGQLRLELRDVGLQTRGSLAPALGVLRGADQLVLGGGGALLGSTEVGRYLQQRLLVLTLPPLVRRSLLLQLHQRRRQLLLSRLPCVALRLRVKACQLQLLHQLADALARVRQVAGGMRLRRRRPVVLLVVVAALCPQQLFQLLLSHPCRRQRRCLLLVERAGVVQLLLQLLQHRRRVRQLACPASRQVGAAAGPLLTQRRRCSLQIAA